MITPAQVAASIARMQGAQGAQFEQPAEIVALGVDPTGMGVPDYSGEIQTWTVAFFTPAQLARVGLAGFDPNNVRVAPFNATKVVVYDSLPDRQWISATFRIVSGRLQFAALAQGKDVSLARSFFTEALPFIASILSVAGALGPLTSAIGNSIVPTQLAQAYPGLANGIGNVAVSTLTNGGDIERAVTNYVAGGAGGLIGSQVATLADSAAIGRLASSVSTAAMLGGDPERAALNALASMGARSVSELYSPGRLDPADLVPFDQSAVNSIAQPGETGMWDEYGNFIGNMGAHPLDAVVTPANYVFSDDQTMAWAGGTPGFYDDFMGPMPNESPADSDVFAPVGNANPAYSFGDGFGFDPNAGSNVPLFTDTPDFYVRDFDNPTAPPSGPGSPGSFDFDRTLQSISAAALTAMQLVRAWEGSPIQPGTATTRPNSNGTLTQSGVGGPIQVPMPKGQPYVLPGGNIVTNNGDGTYTTVTPGGQRVVTPYPGQRTPGASPVAGMSSGTMLALGAGALGLLFLARR